MADHFELPPIERQTLHEVSAFAEPSAAGAGAHGPEDIVYEGDGKPGSPKAFVVDLGSFRRGYEQQRASIVGLRDQRRALFAYAIAQGWTAQRFNDELRDLDIEIEDQQQRYERARIDYADQLIRAYRAGKLIIANQQVTADRRPRPVRVHRSGDR